MAEALEEASTESISDEMDIDVEFGADELGAAAPRESVRVEDPPEHIATGVHTAIDVAALQPDLPPDEGDQDAGMPEFTAPALPPGREPQVQERQEFARVDADLLDTLLNNAGEVSIFRSRLEQQVSSIEFNLGPYSSFGRSRLTFLVCALPGSGRPSAAMIVAFGTV